VAHEERVMGTMASLRVRPGDLGSAAVDDALAEACAVLHRADELFSTWNPDSPISRLRRRQSAIEDLPAEASEVVSLCRKARWATNGWFDPWAMPGGFDPTGLVKGWAAERAALVLRRRGLAAGMVNAGGDISVFGEPEPAQPWRIGVRDPWRADALACVLQITSAIATSGCYERGNHLFDPFAGTAAATVPSATVTGPSLALADALATALAVGGERTLGALTRLRGYDAYLIRGDGSQLATGGIVFDEL